MDSRARRSLAYAVLLASSSTISCATEALDELFHLQGICNIEGDWILSIKDDLNRHQLWLKEGQSYGELHLSFFDPTTGSAELFYNNKAFSLTLAESNYSPISVIENSPSSIDQSALIESKVEKYRQGMQMLLAEPTSGPRPPQVQAKLERELEASISNYRENLLQSYANNTSAPSTELVMSEYSSPLQIKGTKRRNQVNSRIWASDHIREHGLPMN